MKHYALSCLALIQTQPASISVPDSVLALAKHRIIEQSQNEIGLEVVFDQSNCAQEIRYQITPYSLILNSDNDILEHDQSLSFQELIDGKKINFAFNASKIKNQVAINVNPVAETHSKFSWKPLLLGAVGFASAFFVVRKASESSKSDGFPIKVRQFK